MYKYKFCKIIDFGAINNPKELFQEIKSSEKLWKIDRVFETNLENVRKVGNKPEKQKEKIANHCMYLNTQEEIIQYLMITLQ